jgi:inosine-uridine nucleoside N-ribohydrolase
VINSSIPLTFVPLEVTHTVEVRDEVFEKLSKLASDFGKKLTPMLRHFQKRYKENENFDYPVAHDPCTIYYLLRPEDFQTRKVFVEI